MDTCTYRTIFCKTTFSSLRKEEAALKTDIFCAQSIIENLPDYGTLSLTEVEAEVTLLYFKKVWAYKKIKYLLVSNTVQITLRFNRASGSCSSTVLKNV